MSLVKMRYVECRLVVQKFFFHLLQREARRPGPKNWKQIYGMCRNSILNELKFWVTKRDFFDLVHHGTEAECSSSSWNGGGMQQPIMFIRNPKIKLVDYVASAFVLIPHDAFTIDSRHTIMNMPFTDFMLLYLNDPHLESYRLVWCGSF